MNNNHKDKWAEVRKCVDHAEKITLGKYYSYGIKHDLKHIGVIISRYKFVSKMLKYRENIDVLEVGCSEGIGVLMLSQEAKLHSYTGIDLDEEALECANELSAENIDFICTDFFSYETDKKFDAIFSLDVIEHINLSMEEKFVKGIVDKLKENGCVIIGTPNVTMSPYASEAAKQAHINLYDQRRLYVLLNKYFENVFIFNMNDEIVSTQFEPMACYIFALCCGIKEKR